MMARPVSGQGGPPDVAASLTCQRSVESDQEPSPRQGRRCAEQLAPGMPLSCGPGPASSPIWSSPPRNKLQVCLGPSPVFRSSGSLLQTALGRLGCCLVGPSLEPGPCPRWPLAIRQVILVGMWSGKGSPPLRPPLRLTISVVSCCRRARPMPARNRFEPHHQAKASSGLSCRV